MSSLSILGKEMFFLLINSLEGAKRTQRLMVDLQVDPDYHEQSKTLLNVPRREDDGGG